MEKLVGDRVEQLTATLGIKPCKGCHERAMILNNWSRRGFVKSALASMTAFAITPKVFRFLGGNTILPEHALQLVRTLNTVQARFASQGGYAPKGNMLGAGGYLWEYVNGPASKEKGYTGDFIRSINLESDEILPGWMLDFHLWPDGYTFVLGEKVNPNDRFAPRNVFITDQVGVILQAVVNNEQQPAAKDLRHAKDFPGAIAHNLFVKPRENFFTRLLNSFVVYASSCVCRDCCQANDCSGSWGECCNNGGYFNCGCGNCVWCCGCGNSCLQIQPFCCSCSGSCGGG